MLFSLVLLLGFDGSSGGMILDFRVAVELIGTVRRRLGGSNVPLTQL